MEQRPFQGIWTASRKPWSGCRIASRERMHMERRLWCVSPPATPMASVSLLLIVPEMSSQCQRAPSCETGLSQHSRRTYTCCVFIVTYTVVQAGKKPADISLGRYLADTVTGIPRFEAEEFESMLTDSTQDSLLVMYLSNLVRSHLALADRLGTSTLPLL